MMNEPMGLTQQDLALAIGNLVLENLALRKALEEKTAALNGAVPAPAQKPPAEQPSAPAAAAS